MPYLPERAVGRSASHGAEQVRVDLNDLLHGLRGDVWTLGRARVHRDEDASLEDEAKGGSPLGKLDLLSMILVSRAKVLLAVLRRISLNSQGTAVKHRLTQVQQRGCDATAPANRGRHHHHHQQQHQQQQQQ